MVLFGIKAAGKLETSFRIAEHFYSEKTFYSLQSLQIIFKIKYYQVIIFIFCL